MSEYEKAHLMLNMFSFSTDQGKKHSVAKRFKKMDSYDKSKS